MPDSAKPAAGSEPQPSSEPPAEPVALYYTGDASGNDHIHGIPARDLTAADLDRLAYVETVREGETVTVDAITKRLAESPLYRKTAPKES